MHRVPRKDPTLGQLLDERDHVSIQISLLDNAETPDPERLQALRHKLDGIERRILKHVPADA